jgi:bifunctional DNase/RNase
VRAVRISGRSGAILSGMVALKIRGFLLDRDNMPIVMLVEESGQRVLPVWVGPSEASAIIVELESIRSPEPLTHDLLAGLFLQHGLSMERLEIYRQPGSGGCAARVVYRHGLRRYTLETRPSDGLALAVRLGAPILGEEELLAASEFSSILHAAPSRSLLFLRTPADGPAGGDRVTFN